MEQITSSYITRSLIVKHVDNAGLQRKTWEPNIKALELKIAMQTQFCFKVLSLSQA